MAVGENPPLLFIFGSNLKWNTPFWNCSRYTRSSVFFPRFGHLAFAKIKHSAVSPMLWGKPNLIFLETIFEVSFIKRYKYITLARLTYLFELKDIKAKITKINKVRFQKPWKKLKRPSGPHIFHRCFQKPSINQFNWCLNEKCTTEHTYLLMFVTLKSERSQWELLLFQKLLHISIIKNYLGF